MEVRDHRKIARLMVIQGVSHRDMAAAVGWKAHSYVGRIVRGETRNVDADAAAKIAHVLGVAIDDLFLVRVSSDAGRQRQLVKS